MCPFRYPRSFSSFFFFNDTATTEIYTLSLHDALPIVIKPVSQGSTLGITIIRKTRALRAALDAAFAYGPAALIEEYIDGRELTVAILNDRPLPIVEIVPKSGFYDLASKYTPGASHYQ